MKLCLLMGKIEIRLNKHKDETRCLNIRAMAEVVALSVGRVVVP